MALARLDQLSGPIWNFPFLRHAGYSVCSGVARSVDLLAWKDVSVPSD